MNQILAVRRPVEALGEKDDRDRDLVAFDLATAAVSALLDEAELTPKPALVDRRGSGAHHDLDLTRVRRSARALEDGFAAMARAAAGEAKAPSLALWASPGGSTDLLSVTLFLDRVDGGCVRVQAA